MINMIVHRGKSYRNDIENSKEAIEKSLALPYVSGVEIDVRMTKDGQFVLLHDPILDRVSDGTGFVSNKTLTELKKLHFGSSNHFVSITTLESILKLKTDKILFLDLKCETFHYDIYLKKLYRLLNKYRSNHIRLCGFRYEMMETFQRRYHPFQVGYFVGYFLNYDKRNTIFDFVAYQYHKRENYSMKKNIYIFDVNDVEAYKELEKRLITPFFIITDYPYLFSKL